MSTNAKHLKTLTTYISAFNEIPYDPNELVSFAETRDDLKTLNYTEAQTIINAYQANLSQLRDGLKAGTLQYSVSGKHVIETEEDKINTNTVNNKYNNKTEFESYTLIN
eukprot:816950_1